LGLFSWKARIQATLTNINKNYISLKIFLKSVKSKKLINSIDFKKLTSSMESMDLSIHRIYGFLNSMDFYVGFMDFTYSYGFHGIYGKSMEFMKNL
jgi:hypothetical protein